MTTLNITFKNNVDTPRFPVHCQYGGQHQPQPAYIYLDLRDGDCGADYNGEMGSTPCLQWHNIFLTFPISAETMADQIEELINSNADKFQAILDDSEIEWDGNNNVGKFGETATEILTELAFFVGDDGYNPDGIQSFDSLLTMIDSSYFEEWLGDTIESDYDLESLSESLVLMDGEGDCYFTDEMKDSNAILCQLKHIWSEKLYSGHDIPKEVAQYLLNDGSCDDSQWLDELNEFANA